MQIAVIQPSPTVPPGRLGAVLEQAGLAVDRRRPYAGDRLPSVEERDGVVVLGGEMGAYDVDDHPYLVDLKATIRQVVEAGVPLLGICLGAQLLADAMGGRAYLADRPEVGLVDLELTGAGRADPLIGPRRGRVLAIHQDTFDLPSDATLLARSDRFPHAFRVGRALGLQFHPEADAKQARAWLTRPGSKVAARAGVVVEEVVAEVAAADPVLEKEARTLFRDWLEEVRRSAGSSATRR